MKLTLIIVAIIILVILIIAFITFKIAFARTDKVLPFPDSKCYQKYENEIKERTESLRKIKYEEIYIESFDKTKLFGRYYHNSNTNKIDICFHGYKGEAIRDFCGAAETIKRTKHNMLLIDERAHGKSKGRVITFGIKERLDGLKWIEYVIKRFGKKAEISLYGVSMGAATVLMMSGLKLPNNVKVIVADSPYDSPKDIIKKVIKDMKLPANLVYPFVYLGARIFGGFNPNEANAIESVKKSKIPILIFHGKDDNFVPYEMSEKIYENINSKKDILITPNADHGLSYMVDKEKYYEKMLNFIKSI